MPEETPTQAVDEKKEEPETFNRKYVEELRDEAASWRKKLREVEKHAENLGKTVDEFKSKGKTENERLIEEKVTLVKEKELLEASISSNAVSNAVKMESVKRGVVDPEIVSTIIDQTDIEYENGKVTGVKKAEKIVIEINPIKKILLVLKFFT